MSIDRISSSSLIETMRALARDRVTGPQPEARTSSPSAGEAAATASTRQTADLRRRLRELATDVDLDDAPSLANVRTPALREIILWEFGSDFRKDAQYLPMVDAISSAMDADPRLQQRFVELIAGLRKG